MSMYGVDITSDLIADFVALLISKGYTGVTHSELFQISCKKFKVSFSENDFSRKYTQACVEYWMEGKSKESLNFFRDKRTIAAFRALWYENYSPKDFAIEIREVQNSYLAENPDLVEFDGLEETMTFAEHYESAVRDSQSTAQRLLLFELKEEIGKLLFGNTGISKPSRILSAAGASVPANFLGRENELEKIKNRLNNGGHLLLVNAEGGMGKTTLAAKYWNTYAADYKHLAWIFCQPDMLTAMLNELAVGLGLQEVFKETPERERQISLLRNALANLEKPCLLVLDNANDEKEVRDFYSRFGGMDLHILMTSRCQNIMPDAQNELRIESLLPDEAKELFKQAYDEKTPEFENLLDRFLVAVGYNTLCIDVFGKNLAAGGGWGHDMKNFLEHLENKGLWLGEQSFFIATEYAAQQKKLLQNSDEIMEVLYNIAELEEQEKNLLVSFAVLPAENHPPEVLATLLTDGDKAELKNGLDRLRRKGWLSGDGRSYRISPVIQKVVLSKHKEQIWDYGAPIIARLTAFFKNEGYHSVNIKTAAPFAALVFGIIDLLKVENENILELVDKLWFYYNATGNLSKAIEAGEKMAEAAKKIDDKNGLAISYSKLGSTHSALGDLQKALEFYQDETQLFEELYDDYPQNVAFKNGLAIAYSKLGETHSALGNLQKALEFYQERSRLGKELYDDYPQNVAFKNGLAIAYSKLGETHSALGNLQKALEFYQERSRLGKELYDDYPQNVAFKNGLAIAYSKLGETHSALGNLQQALEFYQDETQLFEELYDDYPQNVAFKNGLAISYEKLGSTHSALGNLQKALVFFEKYNELEKELYNDFPQNVEFKNNLAISYSKLGETHSALDDLQKALVFFEKYNELEKELYNDYPQNVAFKNGLAIAYSKLGETHSALGNLQKALEFFEKDAQLTKELYEANPQNVAFKNGLAVSYSKLGSTHSALGNLQKALEFFEKDAQLTKELYDAYPQNVAFKNGLAFSYSSLGQFYRDHQKDKQKAREYFELCYQLWKELSEAYPAYVEFSRNFNWAKNALEGL